MMRRLLKFTVSWQGRALFHLFLVDEGLFSQLDLDGIEDEEDEVVYDNKGNISD